MANSFLLEQLPVDVVESPGSIVSLSSILTAAFGANWDGYSRFWLAYYGASWLATAGANDTPQEPFSYWNPSNPTVSEWLQNGTPITAATVGDFYQVSSTAAQVSSCALEVGNDIAPVVFLTVPISVGTGTPSVYVQYEINIVAPGLQGTPHGPDGEPTPADIVASAQRYASAYSGVLNTNDCGYIAGDLAAAAGAPLDDLESESLNPLDNQSAGFWRVVYRGTPGNAVADWQTLVQPGDIVRMGWAAGGEHTTTVLSVNADGSITVFDNADTNASGQEDIGIHTVNYDQKTDPTTVTIFRLTSDGLYLINGNNSSGEILNGTPQYNNEIAPGSGNDIINCGPNNDIVQIAASATGTKEINGGGGDDTVVFASLSSANAQIAGSTGQPLHVIDGTIYVPSGQAATISWSGGSETLNQVSAVQFTDQTLNFATPLPTTVSSMSASTDTKVAYATTGHVITITMELSAAVTVGGTPTLQLNDHEVAAYASGSGTNVLTFTDAVQASDSSTDLQVTGLNLPAGASILDAFGNAVAGAVTADLGIQINTPSASIAEQIGDIYGAVLQRGPTSPEVTSQLSVASTTGLAAVISTVVNSSEAEFNVYPIVQIIQLATGNLPTAHQLAGWVPFIEQNGVLQGQAQTNALLDQMAEAFVASDNFAKVYSPPFTGIDVNPNSPVTAQEMQVIIQAATGIASTPQQVNAWLALGLTVDQVFVDFALGDQHTAFSKSAIQQFLTTAADSAAGIQASASIVGSANASLVAHA